MDHELTLLLIFLKESQKFHNLICSTLFDTKVEKLQEAIHRRQDFSCGSSGLMPLQCLAQSLSVNGSSISPSIKLDKDMEVLGSYEFQERK